MVTLENAKKLMDSEIERAKKLLDLNYLPEERKWLESTLIPFGKEESAVKLFVLAGIPPKGYVLADYANGIVKSFRKIDLRTLKTYRAYKKGEILKPKPGEELEEAKVEKSIGEVEKSIGEELEEAKVEKSIGEELEEAKVEKSI